MKCEKKDCIYRKKTSSAGGVEICDYITIAGKSRGCSSDRCDKYKKKMKEGEKPCIAK